MPEKKFSLFRFLKRSLIVLLLLIVVAVVFIITTPQPVLRGLGNWLVDTDDVQPVDVLFVLSGGAGERGKAAAQLMKGGLRDAPAVCTGSLIPNNLALFDLQVNEGALTQMAILKEGIDPTRVSVHPHGTSTWEEAEVIWQYARDHGLRRIGVLSSAFHTRRIRWCMEKLRQPGDAELRIYGAPPQDYDRDRWWQSEGGLLFVNNECVKYSYYLLSH